MSHTSSMSAMTSRYRASGDDSRIGSPIILRPGNRWRYRSLTAMQTCCGPSWSETEYGIPAPASTPATSGVPSSPPLATTVCHGALPVKDRLSGRLR